MLGLAVLGFAVWLLAHHRDELTRTLADVGAPTMVLSGALAVVGTVLIGRVWLSLVRGLGVDLPTGEAQGVFFSSQLGKYLPGSLWPVLAQMELGRRWGASRSTMLLANLLLLLTVTVTGLAVGAILLPWTASGVFRDYGWSLLLLLPLALTLHPRVLPWLLGRGLRLLGREAEPIRLSGAAVLRACTWCLGAWLVLGLHLYVLTARLGAGEATAYALGVGAMGLGWAVGLIVIPVPAGAGVRDGILVATLSGEVGVTRALAVAAASRLLLLMADVALAAVAVVLVRRARRRRPTRPGVSGAEATRSDRGTAASG